MGRPFLNIFDGGLGWVLLPGGGKYSASGPGLDAPGLFSSGRYGAVCLRC